RGRRQGAGATARRVDDGGRSAHRRAGGGRAASARGARGRRGGRARRARGEAAGARPPPGRDRRPARLLTWAKTRAPGAANKRGQGSSHTARTYRADERDGRSRRTRAGRALEGRELATPRADRGRVPSPARGEAR